LLPIAGKVVEVGETVGIVIWSVAINDPLGSLAASDMGCTYMNKLSSLRLAGLKNSNSVLVIATSDLTTGSLVTGKGFELPETVYPPV
jgi:hypothetical protein